MLTKWCHKLLLQKPFLSVSLFSNIEAAFSLTLHTERKNPILVFPEKELRGLSPNFHIHVSVSDLYILRIGQHIFLQQNRQTDHGNI
jgi:hypothetical protein